jgi:hypothetical protein
VGVAREVGGSSCGLNVVICGRGKSSGFEQAEGCVGRHLENGRAIGCLDEKGRERGSWARRRLEINEKLE